MNYVYSTMSAGVTYQTFAPNVGEGIAVVEKSITINGGANVVDKKHVITPKGVVTEVSDADLEILESIWLFKKHKENGFIQVEKKSVSVEKIVADMEERDKSSPVRPEDYKDNDPEVKPKPKPTTNRNRGG